MKHTLKTLLFVCFSLSPDPPQQPLDVHPQLPERGVEHHGKPQDRGLRPESCGGGSGAHRK